MSLEQNWKDGFHVSSSGKTQKLSEMATSYLKNAINKYRAQGYDVTALEEELAKRNDA